MADGVMKVTLVGRENVTARLRDMAAQSPIAVQAGLFAVGAEIMRNAKRRTPVLTGTLRGSGYVTIPTVSGTRVSCKLGFGGAAKAYALVQHERTDFHHKEGEAKFLTNAVKEVMGGKAHDIYAAAVAACIKRGVTLQAQSDIPSDPGQGGSSAKGRVSGSRRGVVKRGVTGDRSGSKRPTVRTPRKGR